jgi:hypothetical protein
MVRLVMRPLLALLVVFAATASPALAAPPPNDNRADARPLALNETVNGTTVEATFDQETEGQTFCAPTDATVWYRFTPPRSGNVVVQLDAGGNLDAAVGVFERTRSQLQSVGCQQSDRQGQVTMELSDLDPEKEHLIQVSQFINSDPGDFTLGVLVAAPPASPPGKPLPARGVKDSVDRLVNPSDAYHQTLFAGVSYRVSDFNRGCVRLEVFGPGTRSFDSEAEKTLRCGGYRLFTPEKTGRHFFVATAGSGRGAQPYRLRVARAGADDTVPGIFIRNNARVKGRVNGRIDSLDLYRFDITRPSNLTLRVSGGPDLFLLGHGARRLDSGSFIEGRFKPGRYYAAVRGSGKYTLRRISRVITHATTRFNGREKARSAPGQTVSLTLNVRPGVSGRGVIRVERLDPVEGWQFLRRYQVRVSGGRAAIAFTPPSVGHYRAASTYRGTRIASRAETGLAKLHVRGPLVE